MAIFQGHTSTPNAIFISSCDTYDNRFLRFIDSAHLEDRLQLSSTIIHVSGNLVDDYKSERRTLQHNKLKEIMNMSFSGAITENCHPRSSHRVK